MKSKLLSFTLPTLTTALFVVACSSGSKDKSTQLAELKAKQAELASQISSLEKEISAENPTTATRRAKEVAVVELAPKPFDHYIKTQGAVEAIDNILVSAKTMGIVTKCL